MLGMMLGGSLLSGLFGMSSANKSAKAQENASRYAADAQLAGTRESNNLLREQGLMQEALAREQMDLQQQNYLRSMEIARPYQEMGARAISGLETAATSIPQGAYDAPDFSDYEQSPYFAYMQEQGQDAIAAGAAARGINLSSATLRDSGQFNQDIAGAGFNDWYGREIDGKNRQIAGSQDQYNRLLGLVNVGQGGAGQQISAGNTLTSGNTNALTNLGSFNANNAQAMGRNIMSGANATAQGYLNTGQARASGYAGQNQAFQGMMGNFASLAGTAQAGGFNDPQTNALRWF